MKRISVLTVVRELSSSNHLVTRLIGQKTREKIIEIMGNDKESVFVLDFEGVGIIDFSGADELVIRLLTRILNGEIGDKYILLENLDTNHEENIKAAFQINKKYAVLHIKEEKVELIGTIKKMLIDIMIKVYNENMCTAREMSDVLGNEINLVGTKLLQLVKLRLIKRQEEALLEGGRQYTYKPLIERKLEL